MKNNRFVYGRDEFKLSSCMSCEHKSTKNSTCKAYPKGIPEEILDATVDHRKPYKGDNGITYEPIDKKVVT